MLSLSLSLSRARARARSRSLSLSLSLSLSFSSFVFVLFEQVFFRSTLLFVFKSAVHARRRSNDNNITKMIASQPSLSMQSCNEAKKFISRCFTVVIFCCLFRLFLSSNFLYACVLSHFYAQKSVRPN